jgi:hypothetical protein
MSYRIRAGLFFAFLSIAPHAHAICGDVTGDGQRGATDALAVLRAATGQDVDLVCENDGPTELRFFNDFNCGGGSSTSTATFNGFTFSASSGNFSDYQTVDRETIDTMQITLCGGDYNFPGPLFLSPGRKLTFFMAILSEDVYGAGQALFVIYDDGEPAQAFVLGESGTLPASGVGYAFGSLAAD